MTRLKTRFLHIALATIAGVGGLFVSEQISLTKPGSLVTEANARIGRPLTPMSYAGVARRTTRRAVVGGAVVGGAVAAGGYGAYGPNYGSGCVRVVGAYGRMVTRCY
jgi:hypothetical protein